MYDKALELDPHESNFYHEKGNNYILKFLGHSLHHLKRYEEAIQMFNEALELDHNS